MTDPKSSGLTAILYDNEQIAVLEGAVSLPLGAVICVDETDYVVHRTRVSIRPSDFDIYYDCHMAEQTGAQLPPL